MFTRSIYIEIKHGHSRLKFGTLGPVAFKYGFLEPQGNVLRRLVKQSQRYIHRVRGFLHMVNPQRMIFGSFSVVDRLFLVVIAISSSLVYYDLLILLYYYITKLLQFGIIIC